MNTTREDENSLTTPESPAKQSGLGIASFVLAIISIVGVFTSVMYVGYVDTTDPGRFDNAASEMAIGFAILFFLLLALIGLVLGIIGLFQSHRRRILAGLGVGLTLLCAVLVVAMIALGLSVD